MDKTEGEAMLTTDNILTITGCGFDESFTMTMDLNVLVNEVGKKTKAERWQDPKTGVWYQEPPRVMFPLPKAKKAIAFMLRNADPDEIETIDQLFGKNEVLYKAWSDARKKTGHGTK